MGKRVPDPRNLLPSKADPEHRSVRKELEKKHGLGFTEPLLLGLLATGLIWNMETQVKKCELKKERQEKEWRERSDAQDRKNYKEEQEERRRGDRIRARSSRRAAPPRSMEYRDDGDNEEDHYYPYNLPRASDRDHGRRQHHYDDEYDQPRGHPRRDRYYVDDVDGVPRNEYRRSRGGVDDRRSEYTDANSRGSHRGSTAGPASHYSGSQRLGDQYDDGFEKKRFDSMPTEPLPEERRYRRSRRDSW